METEAGREGGIEALEAHPPKGVKPKLSVEQKAQIPGLLVKGAQAYGFRGDVWTGKRITEVLSRSFGVRYHPDYVGRLLRETGWSPQQPIERATQRNEEAIKQWYEDRWPDIKKKPKKRNTPFSGEMKRVSICYQWLFAHGHLGGKLRSCG
jgi:transposase